MKQNIISTIVKTVVKQIGKQVAVGGMQASVGAVTAMVVTGTVAVGGGGYIAYQSFQAATVSESEQQALEAASALENAINETIENGTEGHYHEDGTFHAGEHTEPTLDEQLSEMEDVHTHTWEEQILSEATCSTTGSVIYSCSECKYSYQDTIPLTSHTAGEWIIVTEPTVYSDGLRIQECSACGQQLAVEVMPIIPCTHDYKTDVVSNPTCESDGLTRYECAVCGSTYETTQAATGHNYETSRTTSASCDSEGHIYSKCTNCGKEIETGTIGKTSHNWGEYVTEAEATCTEDGKKVRECSNCGTKDELVLPATGHYWDVTTVSEPTCTDDGYGTAVCQNEGCSATEDNYTIPATGHTDGEWVVDNEASCEDNGLRHLECSVCSESIRSEAILATGHDYRETGRVDSTCSAKGNISYECNTCGDTYEEAIDEKAHTAGNTWEVVTAPTCTETGIEVVTCADCGARLSETRVIDMIPHSLVGETKEATCTENGYTRDKCSVCGKIENNSVIQKLGHSLVNASSAEPTCTENGYTYDGNCSRCAYDTEREVIPATGHGYKWETTKEATCSEQGERVYICSKCNDVSSTLTIDKISHTYGEWATTTPATEELEGVKTRTCSVCGNKDTQSIPVLPHTHSYSTRVEDKCVKETCTEDGKEVYSCRCGGLSEETISKTGHNYQTQSTVAATCVNDGMEYRKCVNEGCDSEENITLTATGHNVGGWETIQEATDLEEGIKIKTCSVCQAEVDRDTIAKLNHVCSFDEKIEEQEATCTTDGFVVMKCRCNKTERNTILMTNHANKTWVTSKEASYTETGLKENVCDDCHAVVDTEVIPVIAHECDFEVSEEQQATCTESGCVITKCSFCGQSKTVTTPALGHKEGSMNVTKAATCTEAGEQSSSCIRCSATMKTESISATGHTESDWITDTNAGCTSEGSKHKECTVCNETLETEVITGTGHNYSSWNIATEASCENDGVEKRVCSNCGNENTRNISATGHSYGDWIIDVEPTEENEGSKHKECSKCGHETPDEVIEQLHKHDYSHSESRIESTCTTAGSVTQTCECGESSTSALPLKEHTAGDWEIATAATENTEGREVRKCTECGTEVSSRVIAKLEHTHTPSVETKVATCTEDGYEKTVCSSCSQVLSTKILHMTGHSYGDAVVKDATCTAAGSSTRTCTACGDVEKKDIPMIEHQYIETNKIEATCTTAGKVDYECNGCEKTKSETITAKGHSYTQTSVIPATCTAEGYTIETCANCKDTKKTITDVALEHDYTLLVQTKAPSLGVDGEEEIRCRNCGDVSETRKISMLLTDGTDSVHTFYTNPSQTETSFVVGHYDEEIAADITAKVNAYRVANGKSELVQLTSDTYVKYAAARAYEISYLFEHMRPWGTATNTSVGENIVSGATDVNGKDGIADTFVTAWQNSSSHNTNMLSSSYGRTLVKVFAEKMPSGCYKYHCVQIFAKP